LADLDILEKHGQLRLGRQTSPWLFAGQAA